MPCATETEGANEQPYEGPTAYYELAGGQRKKYSACLYPTDKETLEQAEELALAQVGV